METDEKAEQVVEKMKTETEEGISGLVEVKVEPSQVMTVTVDPSLVKSEPVDPLDINPRSRGMVRSKCLLNAVDKSNLIYSAAVLFRLRNKTCLC